MNRAHQGNYLDLCDIQYLNDILRATAKDDQVRATFLKSIHPSKFSLGTLYKDYSDLLYAREHIYQTYMLAANIAQYNKPLVAIMNGQTSNSALPFLYASHACYNTNMRLSITDSGTPLTGGISYNLIRAPIPVSLCCAMCNFTLDEAEATYLFH